MILNTVTQSISFNAGINHNSIAMSAVGWDCCGAGLRALIAEADVDAWWPNGYGEQPLYTLSAFVGDSNVTHRIGFRSVVMLWCAVGKHCMAAQCS